VSSTNIQHMDSKSKDHQSHTKYTQRQIFTRKPIKGENLFFFEMIGSIFLFCTSFTIEHRLNVRLLPLISLAPTRRKHQLPVYSAPTEWKHQLPDYSSTNWMEAPTSNLSQHQLSEGTNLQNLQAPTCRQRHQSPLAPPCHPSFSGCNQMEATTSCVQVPT
jgi:hypothetical protein